ncbi:glycoside hydrolase family 16 protein [Pseudonocardia sp.]|uniref:glycoside hydrolase family 16 protein n=1 Tax=Pseudonocardia sp. TaxID=60912 RepID=UPI002D9208E4|nr:glycoside hydrolase family 16 protein [Pseudonocardia sp.]
MSDTQQLALPDPPPSGPPPADRRRLVLIVVAITAAAALVAVLIAVVGSGGEGRRGGSQTPAPAPAEGGRDTNDPIRPQGLSTLDPSARSDSEAAIRGNWPLLTHDEFDGTAVNTGTWDLYTGETTGGVGKHDPDNLSVTDGTMKLTSHGYSSAGMAWSDGQKYGRWEVRARTQRGNGYGAVILLWPDAEDWPEGGEINFMEIPKGQRSETHFVLHYGEDNSQVGTTVPGEFTQWHNYAVEWAPDHVAGFIDGQEIFRSSDPKTIPPRPMHLAIQQDIGPYGKDWIPPLDNTTPDRVQLEVDWVRIYGV